MAGQVRETGSEPITPDQYQPFENARAFVRRLGLKSEEEWRAYKKSGNKPADIPAKPDHVYSKQDLQPGWSGWRDWLGTEKEADQLRGS
jgi:hypothetical protein